MLDMKEVARIINDLGYRTMIFDYGIYYNYIANCFNWYKGKTPGHTYKYYNGHKSITVEKAKLFMAKRVCEDIASLVCNENMIISVDGKDENEYLLGNDSMAGILGQNDFWTQFNKCYELTAGLGTGAMEVVVENLISYENKLLSNKDTRIKIARYDALHVLPITWDNNGNITEVCFLDEYQVRNDKFLELRLHVKNEQGNYVIINRKCRINDIVGKDQLNKFIYVDNSTLVNEFDTGSNIPWFICMKMPQINSYDITSPMGASCYGDSTDALMACDDGFDAFCGDLKTSYKKTYYDKRLLDRNNKGDIIIPDDNYVNNNIYFVGDGESPVDSKDLIKEYEPTIRSKELTEAIDLALDILSFKVGLGHGYYKFSSTGVQKTATEVVNSNADLYRSVCKMQLGIEKNIYDIIKALLYASNYVFKTNYNFNVKMAVNFDVSLIEDKTKERERALREVELGIITKNEYRSKYYSDLGNLVEHSN